MSLLDFGHLGFVTRKARRRALLRDSVIRLVSSGGLGGRLIIAGSKLSRKRPNGELGAVIKDLSQVTPKIVVFAHFDPDDRITPADRHTLIEYRKAGYSICLVSTATSLPQDAETLADAVVLRPNVGFDFASWAWCIRRYLPRSSREFVEHLVLTNNSMYGPLWDIAPLLSDVARTANVSSLTSSHEFMPHLQSYFLSFDAESLKSDAFEEFWSQSFDSISKWGVIGRGELLWERHFKRFGLSTGSLMSPQSEIRRNELTFFWVDLIRAGLPFVKKSLFKHNYDDIDLSNWKETLEELAPRFDVSLIESDSKG